ncbi:hypothetical protein ANCDUO_12127 [Ancylostoma duodenale]|uniref:Uncharacterized protein n=1 Tax=Ancylostoma duodenale TaxID=51022 RepID=A0A0C2CM57_9BILA|nr:hypothetical protein ANCDUO_12127 [Ancylostoma duodenale]
MVWRLDPGVSGGGGPYYWSVERSAPYRAGYDSMMGYGQYGGYGAMGGMGSPYGMGYPGMMGMGPYGMGMPGMGTMGMGGGYAQPGIENPRSDRHIVQDPHSLPEASMVAALAVQIVVVVKRKADFLEAKIMASFVEYISKHSHLTVETAFMAKSSAEDDKFYVVYSDFELAVHRQIRECAINLLKKEEGCLTEQITKKADWQCIFGQKFATCLECERGSLFYFHIGNTGFVLYRSIGQTIPV